MPSVVGMGIVSMGMGLGAGVGVGQVPQHGQHRAAEANERSRSVAESRANREGSAIEEMCECACVCVLAGGRGLIGFGAFGRARANKS